MFCIQLNTINSLLLLIPSLKLCAVAYIQLRLGFELFHCMRTVFSESPGMATLLGHGVCYLCRLLGHVVLSNCT